MFNVQKFLKSLTTRPGVYQMFDKHGAVIYVGKARNLKKRVSTYFKKRIDDKKTLALMQQVVSVKVIVTETEREALIVENNLIKKYHPRYNILFRDDKSYPYIFISNDKFPRLEVRRGVKREKGNYYGPYPSGIAVREAVNLLQKVFKIRPCINSYFSSRSRPCLQYQIHRCTAPCVGYVSSEAYNENVRHAVMFLEGKRQIVIDELMSRMKKASNNLEYELAAKYRDQIKLLREIQSKQFVDSKYGDTDILAAVEQQGVNCIQVLIIRKGQLLGNKVFFPKAVGLENINEILEAFIKQYYFGRPDIPKDIILNTAVENKLILQEMLSEQSKYKVKLRFNVKGERAKLVKMALTNAKQSLKANLLIKTNYFKQFSELKNILKLFKIPRRLECFDISHTMGEAVVASCVVFNREGPFRQDYRKFNIKGIKAGDDFAAMRQVLERRYAHVSGSSGREKLPDILIVDGGKGQLKQAEEVLLKKYKFDQITLLAIAKGERRKPGLETLYLSGNKKPIKIAKDSPAFYLIQHIRDEAHRFAIMGHRIRRSKARKQSVLEEIAGIGPKRRKELLNYFGGLQGVLKASVDDLANVSGISNKLAAEIYERLHGDF